MLIEVGSFIETKKIALTWHYRRADPEYGEYQARQCKRELEHGVCRNWDVEVMAGKANLEVRPRFVNKGEIAKRLVEEVGKGGELEFVLCLGDDYTDEGRFISSREDKVADYDRYVPLSQTIRTPTRKHLRRHRGCEFEANVGNMAFAGAQ